MFYNLHRDQYGFLLDERYGITVQAYRQFERQYAGKYDRQVQRWASLVPVARGDLVVFPAMSDKVKRALRKGLPKELRANAWYHYSGAQARQEAEPRCYQALVKTSTENSNISLVAQVESDVSHTFSNNRNFRLLRLVSPYQSPPVRDEPASQGALRRILLAIAHKFPNVGYASGLNSIAAALLLITQDEQRSFWILVCIMDKLLPDNYFADMNFGCNVDQDVLTALLAWKLPAVHKKLQKLDMSLHIVTSSWFTHLFVEQLPFEALLRVWDCFLNEGSKVLFRVALALFKLNQNAILAINDPFELAGFIRNMPRRQLDIISLVEVAFDGIGGFSSSWLTNERAKVMPAWKAKHSVRRFSRVSPAYCQAPLRQDLSKQSCFAAVVMANPSSTGPSHSTASSLKIALTDNTPTFERPFELDSSSCSIITILTESDSSQNEAVNGKV